MSGERRYAALHVGFARLPPGTLIKFPRRVRLPWSPRFLRRWNIFPCQQVDMANSILPVVSTSSSSSRSYFDIFFSISSYRETLCGLLLLQWLPRCDVGHTWVAAVEAGLSARPRTRVVGFRPTDWIKSARSNWRGIRPILDPGASVDGPSRSCAYRRTARGALRRDPGASVVGLSSALARHLHDRQPSGRVPSASIRWRSQAGP